MTMKKIFVIVTALFICSYIYSQEVAYVKGKGYKGYIFPKEYSVLGFPPEPNRYTPCLEDVAQAEKILKDSIGSDYVKSNQRAYCKPPINKNTLKVSVIKHTIRNVNVLRLTWQTYIRR